MESPSTLLVVQNLSDSVKFYTEVLQFELIEENADCVKLKVGTHVIFMFQGTSQSINYEHGENANSTLVFAVENLDKKIAELKAKGVHFMHQAPNQNKWGRYAAFKDPSNIVHELMEFFPK